MTGTTVVLTLLFTDIEGSTLMWEQDSKKMEAAVAIHFELLQRAITDHHGSVVKKTGDGVFATFNDPLESVRAVAVAQRELAATDWPGDQVRVRMGLHTGSCSARDGDHYGRAVNKAARVEQSAYGGQVLLSGTTASLVRDDLDEGVSLVYVGEHYFDGIIDPEQLYQLSVSGLDNEHPPLRTRDVGLEQLPLERSGLVGRGDVTPLLEQELGRRRVVSLVGPPGVGKSRLALRVATEVARERDNGVRFIDLAPCRRIDAAAGTIATALGVNVSEESTVVEGIIRALRSTDILVVLDNCEHLLPAVAPVVDAVISTCPRVTVLTTSRERLGVESEFVWPVRPLTLAPADATTIAEIMEASSVQLLLERARAVAPELELTDGDVASILEICRRCDGLPLAVELAAAGLERLAPDELLAALDKSLDALERPGGRLAGGRHGGLREALDASYDSLSEREQAVFDEMAAFAGFATADAIASVVRVPDAEIRDVLDALARRSLLVVERSGGVTRYRQLESVRQYSLEHGRVDDDLRARHAIHFVEEAERRGRQYRTSEGSVAARMMAEQFDDFRLAVNRLVERERWRDAVRIVVALHEFCLFSMRTEQQTWALGLEGRLPNEDRLAAELLGVIAVGAWFRGDHDRALTAGAEALAAAEQVEGPVSTKWARTALLNASAFVSDYDAALEHLPSLTAECRATGDPYWIVNALVVEAIGSASVGLHEQAVTASREGDADRRGARQRRVPVLGVVRPGGDPAPDGPRRCRGGARSGPRRGTLQRQPVQRGCRADGAAGRAGRTGGRRLGRRHGARSPRAPRTRGGIRAGVAGSPARQPRPRDPGAGRGGRGAAPRRGRPTEPPRRCGRSLRRRPAGKAPGAARGRGARPDPRSGQVPHRRPDRRPVPPGAGGHAPELSPGAG